MNILRTASLASECPDVSPGPDACTCLPDAHTAAACPACFTRLHAPAAVRLRMLPWLLLPTPPVARARMRLPTHAMLLRMPAGTASAPSAYK
jgi:hypothetical protein